MNHVETEEYKKNRNKLFTKDIEKRILLVDTNHINRDNTHKTNDYVYNLFSESTSVNENNTGGYGPYKNVIGFRLIKAIIPNIVHIINDMNNKIVYTVATETITMTLRKGHYTIDNLPNAFDDTNSEVTYTGSPTSSVASGSKIKTSGVLVDTTNYNFSINTSGSSNFNFVWDTDDITRNAAKLFGFYINGTSTTATSTSSHVSELVPDLSAHFIDIVIDEIPSIACKDNSKGRNIIDRIYIDSDFGSMKIHESIFYGEQNYFFPISLEKLSIKLYADGGETLYNSQKANHSLEFEITLLKNEDLLR
jgi:hypothetical protein